MPTPSRATALGVALLAFAGLAGAGTSPREATGGVARAIEEHYFDPARGQQIATELRADAAKGAFDGLTDPRDLATALTDRLRPLDRHFNVTWSADAKPAPAGARAPVATAQPAAPPRRDPQERENYGIRRVEVQPGNIGYIDLRSFADFEFGKPDQPGRLAIEAALQLVAGVDALIIDLRANGGGSPAMVGYLSSAFTPKGADIYNTFRSREGTTSEAPADWYATPRLHTPLYVLISARTGSAAEAFAYTMKNAKRAVVVGEASAGAANPGDSVEAGNGYRVFVSSGSPVSPITKTNWEGDGVIPDVAADSADAADTAKELALSSVLKQDRPEAEKVDTRWALEALRAERTPPKDIAFDDYAGDYGTLKVGRDGDRLLMRRGRRPPVVLLPLGHDAFTFASESSLRVVFERDAEGRVRALETRAADGSSSRHRRDE